MSLKRKRSFAELNNNSETHYDHHDGSMGDYIGAKRRKLVHQFRANTEIESNIFSKHVFFINGRTVPALSELKQLIVSHGGIVMMTLTKHTTVMLADDSPITKLKQYNRTHSKIIITTPQWILQSIHAQKLLNPNNYALNTNTKTNINTMRNYQVNNKRKDGDEEHTKLLKVFGARSTLTDPNFVENFFKSSRLHFIGSFKQTYEEILPQLQCIQPKYDTIKYKQERKCKERYIVHIDMDCYFVSVAIRYKPELANKPCVVCHSSSNTSNTYNHNNSNVIPKSQSTAEISSASYAARAFGIKAGMLLGKALRLCPDLMILPYKFDDYVSISSQMYEIFFSYSNMVQYKSVDEAFIEFPLELNDGVSIMDIANAMRNDILSTTRCPSSAGIASNILLARLATKKAKPNGTYYLDIHEDKSGYQRIMDPMDIDTLPGIGGKLRKKFNDELHIYTCLDLRMHPKWSELRHLQSEFGQKMGLNIYNYLNGIDDRAIQVLKERKTIGAEIGWGVRFKRIEELNKFINDLSAEVSKRMKRIHDKFRGKQICIKVKTKHPDADEKPHKFLGHGWCNTVSRSVTLNRATNDDQVIAKACWNILVNELNVDESIVRAVGIHVSKLNYDGIESAHMRAVDSHRSIESLFERNNNNKKKKVSVGIKRNWNNILPSFSQIDQSVWDSLPRDIRSELSKAYQHNNHNKKRKNKNKNKTKLKKQKRKIKHKILQRHDDQMIRKQEEEEGEDEDEDDASMFCEESFDEYRTELLNWFKTNETPNKWHQLILNLYIDDCIEFDRLENVVYVLKYLKRFALNNPNWNDVSLSVTRSAQDKVQHKHQYKLQL